MAYPSLSSISGVAALAVSLLAFSAVSAASPFDFENRKPVSRLHTNLLKLSHEISDSEYDIHDRSIYCFTQLDRNLLHVDTAVDVTLNVMAINDTIDEAHRGADTSALSGEIAEYQLKVLSLARKTVSDLDINCTKFPGYETHSKSLKGLMDEAERYIAALKDASSHQ